MAALSPASSNPDVELLHKGVVAVIGNDLFKLETIPARTVLKVATDLQKWMFKPDNCPQVEWFASQLTSALKKCLPGPRSSQHIRREKLWGAYHKLRTSDKYVKDWKDFLHKAVGKSNCAIFYQHVGDYMVKDLIENHFKLVAPPSRDVEQLTLNFYEASALQYAAGYVPRALTKKLKKSAHPLKDELTLCLLDLLDDGEDEHTESHEWILSLDRGGLKHINNLCYQLFVAMELEIRRHLNPDKPANFIDEVQASILSNEDVLFYWSMIASDWEEEENAALLPMVVNLWVTVRGFAYASAWVEKYKSEHKKSVQKSKGVRKQLLPAPTTNNK